MVGEQIHALDTILMLDTQQKENELAQQRDELLLRKNKAIQLKLSYQKQIDDLNLQFEIKKLKLKSLEKAVKEKVALLEIGGSTADENDRSKLDLNIANLELKHLSTVILNNEQTMQASLREINLEIGIQEKNIRSNQNTLDQAMIIAQKDGVVTWVHDQIGASVSIGSELVRLADLSTYPAEGTITDMHARSLIPGSEVLLSVNDNETIGHIGLVHPTVTNNIIKFSILLQDKTTAWLRPSLKTEAYVVTAFKKKAEITQWILLQRRHFTVGVCGEGRSGCENRSNNRKEQF